MDENKKAPSTSSENKSISLPISTTRNAAQLRALIVHEVGVHAERAQNGEETGLKILKSGTANYAAVEEGLGVLMECLISGSTDNPAYHRARDRYITAGLALGEDGGGARDARQTYEILWRIIASRRNEKGIITNEIIEHAKEDAYDHVENAFRGTNFAMPGMIYSKLKIYREGLIQNIKYFSDNIDDVTSALNRAMIGKYDHTNETERLTVKNEISRGGDIE